MGRLKSDSGYVGFSLNLTLYMGMSVFTIYSLVKITGYMKRKKEKGASESEIKDDASNDKP